MEELYLPEPENWPSHLYPKVLCNKIDTPAIPLKKLYLKVVKGITWNNKTSELNEEVTMLQ